MKAAFLNQICSVKIAKYNNERKALKLFIEATGEPMAVATVNLPNVQDEALEVFAVILDCPVEDVILIKTWSENEGIDKALEDAGIIEISDITIPTGFVEAKVCKLLQH
jgi:hypothetical protein